MKLISLPRIIIGAALFAAVCQAPASATTYNYVGNPYTSNGDPANFGTHMTASVTFDFDTSAASGTFSLSGGHIADLQLTSGIFTTPIALMDPTTSNLTLTSGVITGWFLASLLSSGGFDLSSISDPQAQPGGFAFDRIIANACPSPCTSMALNFQNPGVWSVAAPAVSTTPLPAALPLFGSALAMFGGIARWRKRRAAMA